MDLMVAGLALFPKFCCDVNSQFLFVSGHTTIRIRHVLGFPDPQMDLPFQLELDRLGWLFVVLAWTYVDPRLTGSEIKTYVTVHPFLASRSSLTNDNPQSWSHSSHRL